MQRAFEASNQPTAYALSLPCRSFKFIPLHFRPQLYSISAKTILDFVQHVQALLPIQGSRGQVCQAEQEIVSRPSEVEATADLGQSAGWQVSLLQAR